MTAGRYAIIVAGAAVSTGAGAKQGLALIVGGRPCIRTQPAPFQGSGSIRVACEVNLLTDEPITIAALYNTVAATPGPKGLTVVVRRLPWTGVLEAQGAVVRPSPQKSAPAAPGDKPAKAPRK